MNLTEEIGFVTGSQDYIIFLEGLPGARVNDLIISEGGGRALITGLQSSKVEAVMLSSSRPKPAESFRLLDGGIRLPLGPYLLGRTINPLGIPIDGKAALPLDGPSLELDVVASGIESREMVNQQLHTGFSLVDLLLPIGRGQRELIVGDPRSGVPLFLLETILHQKDENTICVYAGIGKSETDIKRLSQSIEDGGGASYSIILAATSSLPAPLIAIAPSVAFLIAEFFKKQGRDVLLILDDLGLHAKYLREISLLTKQIPGRESYPGNIFYEHSHLMEMAGMFSLKEGGASITLLPVIETDLENLSTLVPTNIMSQTDGHLLFSSSLYSQGQYPAIDWNRSVTRVGRQTQNQLQKLLGTRLRSLLAEYKELEAFSKFDSELSEETQLAIKQARISIELFRQESEGTVDFNTQIVLHSLVFTSYIKDKNLEFFRAKKALLAQIISKNEAIKDLVKMGLQDKYDLPTFLYKLEDLVPSLNVN